MSFELLLEPLRRVPLFQGLRPIQIAEIARRADRVVFRPEDVIIKEDQAGDAAFLIISGEAVLTSGSAPVETVVPGALLGEMAMLVETTYSSTVVCKSAVKVLKIRRETLHELMCADLSLADHFVAKLTNRLRALANDLKKVDQTLSAEPPSADVVLPAKILMLPSPNAVQMPR